MSTSVSKYYEIEEEREYWMQKAREYRPKTKFGRFKAFLFQLF